MREIAAYSTFLMTMGLVLARPRIHAQVRLGPAQAVALGLLALIGLQLVGWTDLALSAELLWRPAVTLIALMLLTGVASRLHVLDDLAAAVEPLVGASPGRGLVVVFALGFATSAALNNDAAILLLTPLVDQLVVRRFPGNRELRVGFALAVFYSAGVAPLAVSNPINLVAAEYAGIGFNAYAARMAPVAIAAAVATVVALALLYRGELPSGATSLVTDSAPRTKSGERAMRGETWAMLGLLALALGSYPVVSLYGGPIWLVTAACAAIGCGYCLARERATPVQLARHVSWGILLFLAGVFVMVLGLREAGLVDRLADFYRSASGSSAGQPVIVGVTSALASAIMNNHPVALLNSVALAEVPGAGPTHVFAALVGGDLGPRLTPLGSLAGLMWFEILRRRGLSVSLAEFCRAGLVVTIPSMAIALALLVWLG